MKVKYAGRVYDVIDTRTLPGGLVQYGIEDEPGHIDWLINVEIMDDGNSGYGFKSSGASYPTKPACFDERADSSKFVGIQGWPGIKQEGGLTMQAFTIKTIKSDYPFLVIADSFKSAFEVLYQKGFYDTDIFSVQQMEAFKSDHILIEERLTDREILREEVRRELQETMPKWMPEPDGAAGGADRDIYLIRTSKGHYFTSSCVGGNNHYLVLDTLEQLPGLPKED